MPFFDTHAHYDSGAFQKDRDVVLAALPEAGVGRVIDPGCDMESSRAAIRLAEQYDFVYAAVGVHPSDCAGFSSDTLNELRKLCQQEKVVAIGEIGLDYHWPNNPEREWQKKIFRRQLDLAREIQLPVIIHCRDAIGDCMEIIRDYNNIQGVFHCFSGSPETAAELLCRGWYLGFDGPITYPNTRKLPEVAAITPLERILLETDAPYLTPVPYRGKRNDSRYLSCTAQTLASWKDTSVEELKRITWENAFRLFPKVK